MNTWQLHIKGQVQGVGFRPHVYRRAKAKKIKGWVQNTIKGVHIEISGTEEEARSFLKEIISTAPALAIITNWEIQAIPKKEFEDFKIKESDEGANINVLLTPDFGMCKDCRSELQVITNRRYQYPFITCTNCGPRYSIINTLPYDRARTTMQDFDMCAACLEEYQEPLDRRYFSQTNSCSTCGIQVQLYDGEQKILSQLTAEIIEAIVKYWKAGKIVAIKGIGGYLLTCDANNELTINRLRQVKHRPGKPFAVMVRDEGQAKKLAQLSLAESKSLAYPIAPILLLPTVKSGTDSLNEKAAQFLPFDSIAPQLNQLGVMLPYTPFFDLLLQKFGHPIIATSGNVSNSPIVFQDKKALTALGQIADYIVCNNREIVVPQDDSVMKFSYFKKQKIIIRRSRGLAPTYINSQLKLSANTLLATGAMMKSSFSLLHQENLYVSQYLGDLEQFDAQENYRLTLQHFLQVFRANIATLLCDLHPDYFSTHLAKAMASKLGITCLPVQHHIAHFAAILGEHNLLKSAAPILGVIWDGTGLGSDGQIWGGEFFVFQQGQFNRVAHLAYFDFILGNKMPKEPRLSAFALCHTIPKAQNLLKEKFPKGNGKSITI